MSINTPEPVVGRIASDLNLRNVDVGGKPTPVLDFRFAITTNIYKEGEWHDGTLWATVTAWRGAATALANNRAKGDQICLLLREEFDYVKSVKQQNGQDVVSWDANGPEIFSFTDRQGNAAQGTKYKYTVERIIWLDNPKSGGSANISQQGGNVAAADDDDIPF